MKKTDLEKHLAKKLDGRMKAGSPPPRFGQATTPRPAVAKPAPAAVAKPVAVSCRMPAALVQRLRERAVGVEGGLGALLTQAAEQWLSTTPTAK